MSKSTYRAIDLTILCVVAFLLEWVNSVAFGRFDEYFALSIVLPLSLILLVRWNAFGLILPLLGGFAYCLFNKATPIQYAVYCGGNLFIGLNLFWFIRLKRRVEKEVVFTILFVISGSILMNFGRSCVSLIVAQTFPIIRFMAVDALNLVIGIVIILISKRQDGIFEDQNHYLLRLAKEREEKKKQQMQAISLERAKKSAQKKTASQILKQELETDTDELNKMEGI